MDSPSSSQTRNTIQNIYKQAEQEVCKTLIEYHRKIQEDTTQELETAEEAIRRCVENNAEDLNPVVSRF